MSLKFDTADSAVIKAQAEEAAKFSDANFFQVEKDSEAAVFILPPWSQKRENKLLAREIWKMFLPSKKNWICWRSWNYLNPEFGSSDPVTHYVDYLKQKPNVDQTELKDHLPRARFYSNILVSWTRKLPNGNAQQNSNFGEVKIFDMPSTVWNGICLLMQKQGFEVPYHPEKAIMFIVSRTGAGLNTEYNVTFAGQRGATGEETPSRFNLVEALGSVDRVQEIINTLPDLDNRWSPPKSGDNNVIANAEEAKRSLKAKFENIGVDPSSIGGFGNSLGGVQFGGPVSSQPNSIPNVAPPAPSEYTVKTSPSVTVSESVSPPSAPSIPGLPNFSTSTRPSVNTPSVQTPGIPKNLQTDIPIPQIPRVPEVNIG